MTQSVERTDFVSIPVADMQRAKAFYRDVLGLQSSDWAAARPEMETGNVSLYLVDPTMMGNAFAPHSAPIALRVASDPDARSELEARGLQFTGEQDTGVCKMALFQDSERNALMLQRRYAREHCTSRAPGVAGASTMSRLSADPRAPAAR